MNRLTEEKLDKIVEALSAAFAPNEAELRAALKAIANWHPQDTPIQFTDPGCHPHYTAAEAKRADVRKEMEEDAKAPFVSEAFLYTLLGKEDARTFLTKWRRLCRALGVDDDTLYD